MDRNSDRARLIGDRPRDGLTDPPRGVGGELVAAAVLELVDRLHQPDVAFLNQVEELQTAVRVFLGDRHDEAKVGLDQLSLGTLGLPLTLRERAISVSQVLDRLPHVFFDIDNRFVRIADVFLRKKDLLFGAVLPQDPLLDGLALLHVVKHALHVLELEAANACFGLVHFALRALDTTSVALDARDHAVDLLPGEIEFAQKCDALVAVLVELRGVLLLASVRNLSLAIELVLHLRHRRLDALDLVEKLQRTGFGSFEIDLIFLVEVTDDVLDAKLPFPKGLADFEDLRDTHARVQNYLENLVFALFDALGDLDLTLAREQRNRPHLAQIHANRIVRLLRVPIVSGGWNRGGAAR